MAEVQRRHFGQTYDLCRCVIEDLAELGMLAQQISERDGVARQLHTLIDGLSLRVRRAL
ncbi:hypothetical protein ACIA8C_26700 [Nocardia sp. NPDC051321]|uniref:hypothetical protein n=1 Tax=Nocardia sp. NPDC051321 TaxID=3364323 RepID=UPI00378E08D9